MESFEMEGDFFGGTGRLCFSIISFSLIFLIFICFFEERKVSRFDQTKHSYI
jgi:hypothetical protein